MEGRLAGGRQGKRCHRCDRPTAAYGGPLSAPQPPVATAATACGNTQQAAAAGAPDVFPRDRPDQFPFPATQSRPASVPRARPSHTDVVHSVL